MDLLATNQLAHAFYSDVLADMRRPANLARFTFLDERARHFYTDWTWLPTSRSPSCVPRPVRRRRGAHDVRHHGTGIKNYHDEVVGPLSLAYEELEMAAEPGLMLTIYTAEPGSPSEERLRLLASWAASREASDTAETVARMLGHRQRLNSSESTTQCYQQNHWCCI